MFAQLPAVATHDPEVDDRQAADLKERKIMDAMARLPKAFAALPRSASAPDLLQTSRNAEAATTLALTQARAASEANLLATSRERPLQNSMEALFREIDSSLGMAQKLKRLLPFRNGEGRLADQMADRMMLVVDQLRHVHQKLEATGAGAGAGGVGEAEFIARNLTKAASRAFNELTPPMRQRLIDAFHDDGGQLPAIKAARDDRLREMIRLADPASGVPASRDPSGVSAEYRVAQRKHEALNYAIAALEFAVPSKQNAPT